MKHKEKLIKEYQADREALQESLKGMETKQFGTRDRNAGATAKSIEKTKRQIAVTDELLAEAEKAS